ncbi:PDZ domain-containing protein [Candidatus Peregrinibacteria bacterium]|nr:PDZ domain-containing protein [Candidatus Peregrinibacteria bacterium]
MRPFFLFIMIFISRRFQALLTVVSLVSVLVPSGAGAAEVQDVLRTPTNEVVSRGDFIRAAVTVLNMDNMNVDLTKQLPYRRVTKGLEKYVRIAHDKNALESFGYDLLLAQGITRGQALRLLVNLTGYDTAVPVVFTDVKVGTPDERAVRVAVEKEWMNPIKDNLFGVRRLLTGGDAKLLLRKVLGEQGIESQVDTNDTPTIRINYKSNDRLMNLPKTQILESIWSMIEREFLYSEDIDVEEAAFRAAEGLVSSLGDKYTTFMRPAKAQQFQSQINGEVIGIGAQVEFIDEILTIVTPIVGSPAEAAGLNPADQILKVDGVPLAGLSFQDSVGKVRGPKGSTVKLTIRRNGIELEFSVVRNVITVPEAKITWQEDVLIVQLTQFGRITHDSLRDQMTEMMAKNPSGVVLDLRNNPGGLLSAANIVVSIFTPSGTPVVEIKSRKADRMESTSAEQIVPDSVPVVLLINEGSASASEIVAGALQDSGRATLIGGKSFGKGTVQQVLQFNDQSNLKMTIAEWFTPNGRKINGIGISPDIGMSEIGGRDAPLLRALEILR